jgi:hypothetical protein
VARLLWVVALGVTAQGCASCTNGHVVQKPFVALPGDDVVRCVCNLSFNNKYCGGTCLAHVDLDLCLPPALQRSADSVDLGAAPDGGDAYSRAIDEYCRTRVDLDVYHLIQVFSGNWCHYKAPFAPDGGVGHSVECFAQERHDDGKVATASDDGTCRTRCPAVACDYATNCGSGVEDSEGHVYLDRCRCSQVTNRGCPGDPPGELPTEVFCRPPAGSVR